MLIGNQCVLTFSVGATLRRFPGPIPIKPLMRPSKKRVDVRES